MSRESQTAAIGSLSPLNDSDLVAPRNDAIGHLADKPTAQGFVAYWGKSGHREALALSGVERE